MGGAGRHAAICQASHITGPPRWRRYYYLLDAQNSVAVITDQNGGSPENDAYDAWGMRRRPNGSDAGFYNITSQSARGYSGQYQVTNNLIDLNARYYDALLGRFLGVDPMTGSDPFDLQNWNAYSYAGNNPMAFSDPTGLCKGVFGCIGDFFGSFLRHNSWAGQVLVIGASFLCAPAAVLCMAAVVAATQVGVGLLEGQQIGRALEGGAIAGAEVLAFAAVGRATGIDGGEGGNLKLEDHPLEFAENVGGHAIVGGTFSVIQGGKFGSGALAAGFSAGLTPYLGDLGAGDMNSAGGLAKGLAVSAVAGGTASVLGGGKFANGAETGAFGYLFNACVDGCRLKALGDAALMTADWVLGRGASDRSFGSGSVQVDDMNDAPGVNAARDRFYAKNADAIATGGALQPVQNWRASFGIWDILKTISPTQQFVGSYRVDIYPSGSNMQFTLTNNSSFKSLSYGQAPAWERSSFGPGGNMRQIYKWSEPIK